MSKVHWSMILASWQRWLDHGHRLELISLGTNVTKWEQPRRSRKQLTNRCHGIPSARWEYYEYTCVVRMHSLQFWEFEIRPATECSPIRSRQKHSKFCWINEWVSMSLLLYSLSIHDLPGDQNDQIQPIPGISQIGKFMINQTTGQYFDDKFNRINTEENQSERKYCIRNIS